VAHIPGASIESVESEKDFLIACKEKLDILFVTMQYLSGTIFSFYFVNSLDSEVDSGWISGY
jgi:hypothetical protein